MWFAGVAWDADGWELVVLDEAGQAMAPRRYGAAERASLLAFVMALPGQTGERLVVAVDSTNGLIDRALVEAGADVARADPWDLPPRTRMGSVPAEALALAARDRLPSLARLSVASGTMHGRDQDDRTGADASAALAGRLSTEGLYLTSGPDDQPEVALTFDDGPDPRHTPAVLEALERYGAVATFFCVGAAARAHPDLLTRAARSGHLIANHTWSHPFLPDLSLDELRWQIEATGSALAAAAGQAAMPRLVRPPYGAYTPEVLGWLAEQEATTVLWDVDTDDWQLPGPDLITRHALQGARNGSIVLCHDGGGDRSQTVAALPAIIEGLLDRGMRLVSVAQLGCR